MNEPNEIPNTKRPKTSHRDNSGEDDFVTDEESDWDESGCENEDDEEDEEKIEDVAGEISGK